MQRREQAQHSSPDKITCVRSACATIYKAQERRRDKHRDQRERCAGPNKRRTWKTSKQDHTHNYVKQENQSMHKPGPRTRRNAAEDEVFGQDPELLGPILTRTQNAEGTGQKPSPIKMALWNISERFFAENRGIFYQNPTMIMADYVPYSAKTRRWFFRHILYWTLVSGQQKHDAIKNGGIDVSTKKLLRQN